MHVKRRLLSDFETCSVALFATLALGGPLPPRAQQIAPARPPFTSTTSIVAPAPAGPNTSSTSSAPPPNRRTAEPLDEAFRDADSDDGVPLSLQQASGSPSPSRPLDPLDSNKDGSISSAGFDEALK